MAWSDPSSVTTGDLITAATWNQDVVDNAQYLHDNRVVHICLFSESGTGWAGAETNYVSNVKTLYPGGSIDESDLDAAYFSAQFYGDNSSCDISMRLVYIDSGGASNLVSSASFFNSGTDTGYSASSGDIKAGLPTTDVYLAPQTKSSHSTTDYRVRKSDLWLAF